MLNSSDLTLILPFLADLNNFYGKKGFARNKIRYHLIILYKFLSPLNHFHFD